MNTEFNNSINKRLFSKDEIFGNKEYQYKFPEKLPLCDFISLNRKLLPIFIIGFID